MKENHKGLITSSIIFIIITLIITFNLDKIIANDKGTISMMRVIDQLICLGVGIWLTFFNKGIVESDLKSGKKRWEKTWGKIFKGNLYNWPFYKKFSKITVTLIGITFLLVFILDFLGIEKSFPR